MDKRFVNLQPLDFGQLAASVAQSVFCIESVALSAGDNVFKTIYVSDLSNA